MSAQSMKPGWEMVKFGDIAQNIAMRIDPAKATTDVYVGLEHLDPETLHLRQWGHPSDVTGQKLVFKKGDVIFGRRRAYQRKLAVAEFEGICSAHAMVVRAKPEMILPEFLPFFLQSDLFMERAIEISVGSLSPTINWKTLRIQEFPLPPIEEQERIAEILWAADETVEIEYDVIAHLDRLLQVRINRFSHYQVEHGNENRLDDCIHPRRPITYGILKPGLNFEGGIPVVKVRDYPDGAINTDDLLLTTSEIEREYKRSRLIPGDILISIRGTVGRVAEVPEELDGANITQDTARLSIKDGINHQYMRTILESNYIQRQIKARITGLAVQGINLGELRQIKIPIPEFEAQQQLASECHAIRKAQVHANRNIESLRNLMKSYFGNNAVFEIAHV